RDMSRFPTAGHLIAWAGLCPGQNESAGKRKSSRLRRGAPWLKTMLVQCAWAAKRATNSYYSAQFHRLRSRRGPQKAICAVAASILTAIYHMLKSALPHRDLGADDFDRRSPEAKAKRLVTQLAKLGFVAELHLSLMPPDALTRHAWQRFLVRSEMTKQSQRRRCLPTRKTSRCRGG